MKKLLRSGDPFIWLTASALAAALIMVGGLLSLIVWNGLWFFWPAELSLLRLTDGKTVLGQVIEREAIPRPDDPQGTAEVHRLKVKQANRDLLGADFRWIDESAIAGREKPLAAAVIERKEWGNLFGFIEEVREAGQPAVRGPEAAPAALRARLPEAKRIAAEIRWIETAKIGAINGEEEKIRLRLRSLEMAGVVDGPPVEELRARQSDCRARFAEEEKALVELRAKQTASVVVAAADGQAKEVPLSQVVRVYTPNTLGISGKAGFFVEKFWEFLTDDPRESNTEGGVFPAIFGTVLMVLIMSILVTPLGVLAALYLREYARQGAMVSVIRIAVNNLAGVPSIVFGVFGVGFFIYLAGGTIDRIFFSESLPAPTFGTGGLLWASLTLALLTVPVMIVATEEGLAAIPGGLREASLALGATRFETTWRVVLPAVMPSVLTGLILSMARAAGEVAPLMITGVVKLAPALALDGSWPFVHLDRKFMHLGFHIYDVGFQSPNVDTARPMVYATTLLLVAIVLLLNLTALYLRGRLRKKYSLAAL